MIGVFDPSFVDVAAAVRRVPYNVDDDAFEDGAGNPATIVSDRVVVIDETGFEQRIHKSLAMIRHHKKIHVFGVAPAARVTSQAKGAAEHERKAERPNRF